LHGFDFVSMQAWSSEAKTFVTSLSPRLLYPIAPVFHLAPFNPQTAAVFDRRTDVRVSWAMSFRVDCYLIAFNAERQSLLRIMRNAASGSEIVRGP